MTEDSQSLKGLDGWLILVGIGVVLGPIRLIYLLATTFYPIFTDGTWGLLTNPDSEQFTPYIAQLLLFELLTNFLILTASVYLVFLFFREQRSFPKLYVTITTFSFVFILIDAWAATLVFPEMPVFDDGTLAELARSAPGLLVWVPYMLVSKRVKATFIEPQDHPERINENAP